jgi:hypothetical protein
MDDIRIITSKDLALEVAERYEAQHTKAGKMTDRHEQFYQQLIELSDKSIANVNALIGNNSWTSILCHCCQSEVRYAVQLPNEDDYIGSYKICFDCLDTANELAEEYVSELTSTISAVAELKADSSLIPNRAVEFVGITIKDSIQLGDRVEYISSCDKDLVTGEKKIGFVVDDKVCKLTQHEYIMQGWAKVND